MPLALHHLALRTRDPARLEAFYAGILGLAVVRRDGERGERGSVWLRADRVVLMIERAEEDEPGPSEYGKDLITFAVDPESDRPDLSAWREHLGRAGLAIEAETEFTLYFRDPDARRVGVSVYVF